MSDTPLVEIIFADQGLLSDESEDLVGKTPSDYVNLYYQIKHHISQRKNLKILIRNKTLLTWLDPLAIKYGDELVRLKTITYRSALSDKWEIELPSYVTDEGIKNANLLEIDVSPQEGEGFSEILLEYFFSLHLLHNKFPFNKIVDLLSSIDMNAWRKNLTVKLLHDEYFEKVEQWIKASSDENEREIIDIFAKNPDELNGKLMLYKVIQNYPPEYGRRVLEDDYEVFKIVNLNLHGLIIEEGKIDEALSQIEIFFHKLEEEKLDHSKLRNALNCISGYSVREFNFIKNLLFKNQELVDNEIVDILEKRIKPILLMIKNSFEEIKDLIEPKKPDAPDPKWSYSQWIDWALTQYFPYRFWLENVGKTDAFITEISDVFGNWYYEKYLELLNNERNIVYKVVLNNKESILRSKLNLFIVIDNFNYKFAGMLEDLFEVKGYSAIKKETYMSLLPTETKYSKKALLYGDFNIKEIPSDYARIVQKTWPTHLGDKKLKYLHNLSKLEKIDFIEHDIYFLNYLPIDNILHEKEEALGMTHNEEVSIKLQKLVEKVDDFITRFQIADDISVYICSDHGSTKISKEEHNGIDLKYFTEKEIPLEHCRFISIDQGTYEQLADHVKKGCFYMAKDIYSLDENILIAREYFRFKNVNESFYVHGGASPEEVLVPFYIFKKHTERVKVPKLKLLANEFRYSVKSLLKIEISNPNQYPLVDVCLSVINKEVEAEDTIIDEVRKLDVISIDIPCRFYREFDTSENLEIKMVWEFTGKKYKNYFKFPIRLKSIMETAFDFDVFKK